MWDYLIPFDGLQSIFVDLPGHGKSELGTQISMKSVAEQVVELVSEMGLDVYDIVGHSMGGYVALEVKKLDLNCDKLVLLNSNFWEDNPMKKIDRQRVAELVQTKKEGFIQTAIPNLFLNPEGYSEDVKALICEAQEISSEAIAASSIAMSQRPDNFKVVESNPKSTLIIQGEFDAIVPFEKMKESLGEIPVPLVVLPSGHMAHIEHSALVKQALIEFLG